MLKSFHKTIVIGYAGDHPKYQILPSGVEVANFRIGCPEFIPKLGKDGKPVYEVGNGPNGPYKKMAGEPRTEWFDFRVTGHFAKVIAGMEGRPPLVEKGAFYYVEGSQRTRTFDKQASSGESFTFERKNLNLIVIQKIANPGVGKNNGSNASAGMAHEGYGDEAPF